MKSFGTNMDSWGFEGGQFLPGDRFAPLFFIGSVVNAFSGGDDAPPPPPPPPDNGMAEIAKQMEQERLLRQKEREEDRQLKAKERAETSAMEQASKYLNLGVQAFSDAALGAIEHVVKWNETVNERKENEAAVAAGLPPPHTGTNQDWESYLESATQREENEEDYVKSYS